MWTSRSWKDTDWVRNALCIWKDDEISFKGHTMAGENVYVIS